jgi:O-antigen/teichoic acid export membrane protein
MLKFLKDKTGLFYTASSIISSGISMIIGVLMIGWIEPGVLGLWQSLSVLQLYVPFLEAGIPNGLNRELSFLMGKGEHRKAILLSRTAQYYTVFVSFVLFGLTLVTTAILYVAAYQLQIVVGVFTVGLMASLNSYQRYLVVTYRSSQSFHSLSKLYLYYSLFQILLFPLVIVYNYYGLLCYSSMTLLFFIMLMHFTRPIKDKPLFVKKYFKELARTGIPVFITGYLRGISNSFTRIVLLLKGGTLAVGLFTPVNAVGSLISIVPGILGNYFFPKMNFMLGEKGNPRELWPIVVKINVLLAVCSMPFILIIWSVTPIVMHIYFEKYEDSIYAIQLFSLNFLFSGTLVSHNAIYSVKAYRKGYLFVGAELLLRFMCPYILVLFFKGNILTLTAIGVLLSNTMLFVLNFYLLFDALQYKLKYNE